MLMNVDIYPINSQIPTNIPRCPGITKVGKDLQNHPVQPSAYRQCCPLAMSQSATATLSLITFRDGDLGITRPRWLLQ